MTKTAINITGMHCSSCVTAKEIKSLKIKFTVSIILATPLMYFAMSTGFKLPLASWMIKHMALIQFLLTTPIRPDCDAQRHEEVSTEGTIAGTELA